jgi:hypothetical protein
VLLVTVPSTMPRASKTSKPSKASDSPQSASISTRKQHKSESKPKIPLICWDGKFGFRTTKLLDWCLENESAHIKMFSDSTQEAKGEGRKKEIRSTSKNYYFKQAAQAIFANDPNTELTELSQSHPQEFVSRITRRFRE